MDSRRSFATAVAAKGGHKQKKPKAMKPITYDIDGRPTTFLPPTDSQWLAISSYTALDDNTAVSGMVAFFIELLESEADKRHYRGRLLRRSDPFEASNVVDVLVALVEDWLGHPLDEQSTSPGSSSPTGPSSTERPLRRASKSSKSPSPAASTTSTPGSSTPSAQIEAP